MLSEESRSVSSRAKAIYIRHLKADLEVKCHGQFVAIEPDSGDYSVANSLDEAVKLAELAHPSKLTYSIRIGHAAVVHIG
jgi:hypothetical protein